MQDLRRDFVPIPASAPGPNSQAFTLGFVPRAKLTKHKEDLRKKALSLKLSPFLTSPELADINLKKRRREKNDLVAATAPAPPSSAPAALASNRNERATAEKKEQVERQTRYHLQTQWC
jgi:hypothetical protein